MVAPSFKLEQVKYFVKLLTGSENTPVTWQIFYDVKDEAQRPDLADTFTDTITNAVSTLERAQSNFCGIYITVNETDGKGRKVENIVRYRAVFADYDGIAQPVWPITPHFITARDSSHGHAYWLVDDIVTVEQFRSIQRRIAMSIGADTQVVDPCRVLRAPGTLHFKVKNDPKQYEVVQDNVQVLGVQHRYKFSQIEDAFKLNNDQQLLLNVWLTTRDALTVGSGFSDNPIYRQRLINFITGPAEAAVLGSGSATLIRVAGMGYDLGLPLKVTQDLMWEHYDPRCVPSWHSTGQQRDFYDTVARAYQYARNEPGCRTAVAMFSAAEPILPPPPPKEQMEVVRNGDRLEGQRAKIMMPMMTASSAHYELAQVYDGVAFDGTNIVRCKKIFYVYGGRSWKIMDDDVVKSQIQRFYAKFKPAEKLTQGIFKVFCDLVTIESVENGTWLDTGARADNIICFKNGLVDISDVIPKFMEHTPRFFTFNELEYDYQPGAQCPEWIGFLNNIWDFDLELVDQLQEWFGYCLTNNVSLQKFAAFIGRSRAGKGVISGVLRAVVGDKNTSAPTLASFVKDSALHDMSKCSVGFIPDAHSVSSIKRDEVLSNLKAIIGADPVSFHVMYKGTQTSLFKIRLVMSTNNMPEFVDTSGALVNRMLVWPFLKTFAGKGEDAELGKRLIAEAPGVAQWALIGLNRLRTNGRFTEAQAGIREKECIREDMSPLSRFIKDVCIVEEGAFTTTGDIYKIYTLWAKQNNIMHPFSEPKMVREIGSSELPIIKDHKYVPSVGAKRRGFVNLAVSRFDPVTDIEGELE